MKKAAFLSIFIWIIFIKTSVFPCSGIFGADGDKVFAGYNNGHINPMTKIWVKPAKGKWKYGVLFFGYDNFYPISGVNDQGLFFDYFQVNPLVITKSATKPVFKGCIEEEIMRTCSTIEEVLIVFEKYNLSFLENRQIFFGDKTGKSVIIEGDAIVRKKDKFQIITNFRQSLTQPDKITCTRYNIAKEILDQCRDVSKECCLKVLAAMHQEYDRIGTVFSNIHDLKNGIIYLYYFHNYAYEVVIDLKQELEKGYHEYDLPSLFPKNFPADNFLKTFQQQKIISHPAIASEKLKEHIGYYQSVGYYRRGYIPAEFAVFMVENKLYFGSAFMSGLLIPESETKFLLSNIIINALNTSISFEFQKEASNKQTVIVNMPNQPPYTFERVPSDKWLPSLHANTAEKTNYVSIIKDIWINEAEGFAKGNLFTRKASPAFSFTLPANYSKIATSDSSQIMAMTAQINGLWDRPGIVTIQAGVLNIPGFTSEIYLNTLKNNGTNHLLKSTRDITLKDGTRAHKAVIHYWEDEIPVAAVLVYAQKEGKWVYIATHSARDYISIKGASVIAESLVFQ